MDAGRWPSLIAKDQVALAINTTFRGGYPSPRPRYLYRPITFNTQEEQTWFETQIYQGSFWYSFVDADNPALHPNEGCLVVSVGGRQWKIDVTKYTALEITPPDGRNNRYKNIVYFCQARQYLIIQDGLAAPIIWDGSQTRRAGVNEVPVGTIMQFGQGRVWVLKGDALFAGDIEGGPTSILSFTETTFLAGGGALNPSYLIGNVNGLAFIPQQDTSTGVGTLLVFGERGTTSVFAELRATNGSTGSSAWSSSTLEELATAHPASLTETCGSVLRTASAVIGRLVDRLTFWLSSHFPRS